MFSYVLALFKITCGGYNATYYGKTKCYFKVSMCEHLWVSALIRKRIKGGNYSAIKQQVFCNHPSDFDNFSVLASN